MKNLRIYFYLILLFLAACNIGESTPLGSVEIVQVTPSTGDPVVASVFPWVDANAVVAGICFEAASDMATNNRRFQMRTAEEHINFYDAMDNAGLCLRAVRRVPFEFTTGQSIAGLWSVGRGCTARHDVISYQQDDNTRTLTINLQFVTEGECNYELVRPFWISFDANYTVTLSLS